jgi:hypothetical protein
VSEVRGDPTAGVSSQDEQVIGYLLAFLVFLCGVLSLLVLTLWYRNATHRRS